MSFVQRSATNTKRSQRMSMTVVRGPWTNLQPQPRTPTALRRTASHERITVHQAPARGDQLDHLKQRTCQVSPPSPKRRKQLERKRIRAERTTQRIENGGSTRHQRNELASQLGTRRYTFEYESEEHNKPQDRLFGLQAQFQHQVNQTLWKGQQDHHSREEHVLELRSR